MIERKGASRLECVEMDDYVAWYRGGEKLCEGHKVSAVELLRLLSVPFRHYDVEDPDEVFSGGLPAAFADIPKKFLK